MTTLGTLDDLTDDAGVIMAMQYMSDEEISGMDDSGGSDPDDPAALVKAFFLGLFIFIVLCYVLGWLLQWQAYATGLVSP